VSQCPRTHPGCADGPMAMHTRLATFNWTEVARFLLCMLCSAVPVQYCSFPYTFAASAGRRVLHSSQCSLCDCASEARCITAVLRLWPVTCQPVSLSIKQTLTASLCRLPLRGLLCNPYWWSLRGGLCGVALSRRLHVCWFSSLSRVLARERCCPVVICLIL